MRPEVMAERGVTTIGDAQIRIVDDAKKTHQRLVTTTMRVRLLPNVHTVG